MDETWDAGFDALPQGMLQTETYGRGAVVAHYHEVLADLQMEHTPTVNDHATLVAQGMSRQLYGDSRRARQILARPHPFSKAMSHARVELGIEALTRMVLT